MVANGGCWSHRWNGSLGKMSGSGRMRCMIASIASLHELAFGSLSHIETEGDTCDNLEDVTDND